MPKINNIPEAKLAIDGIVKSLAEVQQFMASFESLTAQLAAMTSPPILDGQQKVFSLVTPSDSDTFTSKVILIVHQDYPIRTRDIVRKYRERGFPFEGDDTKLYNSVSACLSYLVNKKGILARSDSGYIPAQISEATNTGEKPEGTAVPSSV